MSRRRSPDRIDAVVARLRFLAETDPAACQRLALDILRSENSPRAIEPALKLLASDPPTEARLTLRDLYWAFHREPIRRDIDCELRTSIVEMLRTLNSGADADIAEAAISTIQPTPPGMVDVAQPLRAGGLLLMAQIDPEIAAYHAAALVTDPHTSAFSGEPAATAIRLLAGMRQFLPIWGAARRPGLPPEALAAALEALGGAPASLVLTLLHDHLTAATARGPEGEADILVIGDAAFTGRFAAMYEAIADRVAATTNVNLARYLAVAARRSADEAAIEAMRAAAQRASMPIRDAIAESIPPARERRDPSVRP
ncbi:MAG: hypothetical protein EPO26_10265 [Chloroflexota bacterium]|nr:MAG: hypothetical protein EPO26_10265 [Chloroflexota bacterium]